MYMHKQSKGHDLLDGVHFSGFSSFLLSTRNHRHNLILQCFQRARGSEYSKVLVLKRLKWHYLECLIKCAPQFLLITQSEQECRQDLQCGCTC